MTNQLIVIAHNIRSAHNVGSLLRTAEGLGVTKVYLTGYTPYPKTAHDTRLPHIADKINTLIHKTALEAENLLDWEYIEDVAALIQQLKSEDYIVAGLEQTPSSVQLSSYKAPHKLALLLGSEVTGIDSELLKLVDMCLEIPMAGKKESFNVIEAASMAMYHCKYVV